MGALLLRDICMAPRVPGPSQRFDPENLALEKRRQQTIGDKGQITHLLAHELMLLLLVDLVPKCLEANLAPRETPKSLDRDARAKNRCSNIFE